jgi:hypothetical protein
LSPKEFTVLEVLPDQAWAQWSTRHECGRDGDHRLPAKVIEPPLIETHAQAS